MNTEDEHFMWRALALAQRGRRTHPNPMVGAVVVRDGRIVGEGWHKGVGTPHAEAAAFADAGEAARGATIYVTLEPCSFTTRPNGERRIPCSHRCLDAGVTRVVAAMQDPDPRVGGQGFAQLREAGVSVTVGVLEETARALNRAYIKQRTTGLPYLLHKAAMTLDGKIAAPGGDSSWVSGEASRSYVHRKLRNRWDALIVGIGTVLADNPSLTTRLPSGRNGQDPLRVVIDSKLRIPVGARVARPGTLVIGADRPEAHARREAVEATGAEVVLAPSDAAEHPDLEAALRLLADRGVYSVVLEGGGELAAGFYAAGLVDQVLFFYAPKIIGGKEAPTAVEGAGLSRIMAEALDLGRVKVRRFGEDLAVEATVVQRGGDEAARQEDQGKRCSPGL